MPTFALSHIQDVKGYQRFEELMVDGVRPMKAFRNEIMHDPKLMEELEKIYAKMVSVANGLTLSHDDFHPLKNPSRGIDEYEFKSKHLRVYCFKTRGGKIVVMGTTKKPKKKDEDSVITRFRNLKNAYLDLLEEEKWKATHN